MPKCDECHAPLDPEDKFCGKCGLPVAEAGSFEPRQPKTRDCPVCQKQNESDAAFCSQCGTDLTKTFGAPLGGKKWRSPSKTLAIALVALLAAGGAGFAWWWKENGSKPDPAPEVANPETSKPPVTPDPAPPTPPIAKTPEVEKPVEPPPPPVDPPPPPTPPTQTGLPAALLAASGVVHTPRTVDEIKTARKKGDIDPNRIAPYVAQLLERNHYRKGALDNARAKRTLDAYLRQLDPSRWYLLKSDVDGFTRKFGNTLDEGIKRKNIGAAFEIFARYEQRRAEHLNFTEQILAEQKFDFTSNRTAPRNRIGAKWNNGIEDAQQLWRIALESNLLSKVLDAEPPLTEEALRGLKEQVRDNYRRGFNSTRQMTAEQIADLFFDALAETYDSNSSYYSREAMENARISAKSSMIGIGAMLKIDDAGYPSVTSLVSGGPAERSGFLKPGDRILSVGQAAGPMTDLLDQRLPDAVALIRGKAGSKVRLRIASPNWEGGKSQIVNITRGEVKLRNAWATGRVVETTSPSGNPIKFGVVSLPALYGDGTSKVPSSHTHANALIAHLNKQGISGLVVDMRGNTGGALNETQALAGVFLGARPVLRYKWSDAKIYNKDATGRGPAWNGPMVVLTDRNTASGAEIIIAALQDYQRAVIIGDEATYGNATIASMFAIKDALPDTAPRFDGGSMRVTQGCFFRLTGSTVQLNGITPDIVFPSRVYSLQTGERSLANPLAFEQISATVINKLAPRPLPIGKLRSRSQARVLRNPHFKWVVDENTRLKRSLAEGTYSLNFAERKKQRAEAAARQESHNEEMSAWQARQPKVSESRFSIDDSGKVVADTSAEKSGFDGAMIEAHAILGDLLGLE